MRDVQGIIDATASWVRSAEALLGLLNAAFIHRIGKRRQLRRGRKRSRGGHRNLGVAFFKTGMFESVAEFRA
jgi:hypothetical protein